MPSGGNVVEKLESGLESQIHRQRNAHLRRVAVRQRDPGLKAEIERRIAAETQPHLQPERHLQLRTDVRPEAAQKGNARRIAH